MSPLENVFDEVYAAHYQRVYGFCARALQNSEEARDVAVLVWRRVWGLIQSGTASDLPEVVTAVAANECVEFLSQKDEPSGAATARIDESDPEILGEVDWETSEVGELAARALQDVRLRMAMLNLSPKQRVAVVMKFGLNMKREEIAQALGCTTATVNTHLRFALIAVSKFLASREI